MHRSTSSEWRVGGMVGRIRKGDAGVKRRVEGGRAGENELKTPIKCNYHIKSLNIILDPLTNMFIAILLNPNYLNIR